VDDDVADPEVLQQASVPGDVDAVGVGPGGLEVLDVPVVLVEQGQGGPPPFGMDGGQGAFAVGPDANRVTRLAGTERVQRSRAAGPPPEEDGVPGGKGGVADPGHASPGGGGRPAVVTVVPGPAVHVIVDRQGGERGQGHQEGEGAGSGAHADSPLGGASPGAASPSRRVGARWSRGRGARRGSR
jgi:hypothetical protein